MMTSLTSKQHGLSYFIWFLTHKIILIRRFAEKEQTATSDAEEVSSTSKNEQPVEEVKELTEDVAEDLTKMSETFDKNGSTRTTTLVEDDDDDLVILS